MKTTQAPGSRPIHIWTDDVEDSARQQLHNMAKLPFLHPHGIAVMPDVHAGIGSTVGTVIATHKAIIPAAVGVDIGCGMNAVRVSFKASDLPDSLAELRHDIERSVPLGAGGAHRDDTTLPVAPPSSVQAAASMRNAGRQLGTLGSGNHFIEICLDENDDVWVVLHSGSRGIGNQIGRFYIEKARKLMERYFITLPDGDLAYLPEDTDDFRDYVEAVQWAQEYALENRRRLMAAVVGSMRHRIPKPFTVTQEAINCHHNYVEMESHYGKNVYVTRKGAIRAREGDLGVIPGSMGARSYIVRGKGNAASYCSCSHAPGAGCRGPPHARRSPWPTSRRRRRVSSAARTTPSWMRFPACTRTSTR